MALGVVILAVSYGAYTFRVLKDQNMALQTNVLGLQGQIASLTQALASTSFELSSTSQTLGVQENVNASFGSQINQLSGTVSSLQTLASIDPQLLEKYSKVYFLSDNYAPASLSPIDTHYLLNQSSTQLFLSGAVPHLEALLTAASGANVPLKIISAYRSFAEQGVLKLDYTNTYGSGANQFSADQGYSEHQLGTAVDFGMQGAPNLRTQFASSTGYAWLIGSAYQFGFVLSYPPANMYYQFEPWHWRYVGVALATYLHMNNEFFYNMGQRDINQYLINFYN